MCNNINRGETYVGEIEEIVQIAHALRRQGTPSKDDKAAALVVRLHQIRRLEPESESSSSEASIPTNITFPTPAIPRNSQVTASTVASCTRVHAVASGPTSPQQPCTRGSQGAGSQARQVGTRVPLVPMGVHIGAELLPSRLTRTAETPAPLGFNFNHGVHFVPCVITNSEGRGIPARYTQVVMGPVLRNDPHFLFFTLLYFVNSFLVM